MQPQTPKFPLLPTLIPLQRLLHLLLRVLKHANLSQHTFHHLDLLLTDPCPHLHGEGGEKDDAVSPVEVLVLAEKLPEEARI